MPTNRTIQPGLQAFWEKIKTYVQEQIELHTLPDGTLSQYFPITGGKLKGFLYARNKVVINGTDQNLSELQLSVASSSSDIDADPTYYSYIRVYPQTNYTGSSNWYNMLVKSGGDMIIGGGASPQNLEALVSNGYLSDFNLASGKDLILTSDSVIHFYSKATSSTDPSILKHGIFNTEGNMYLDSISMNRGYNKKSSVDDLRAFGVRDLNDKLIGSYKVRQTKSDGKKYSSIEAYGENSSNTLITNQFSVGVNADGTRFYSCSDTAKFKQDLGITYAGLGIAPKTSGGTGVNNDSIAINTVFAGPASGSKGSSSFRKLVNADLPVVSIAKGGTGKTTAAEARAALGINRENLGGLTYKTIFTGNVAKGNQLGSTKLPDVLKYRFFLLTLSGGYSLVGFRSASGNINFVGGYDPGNGAQVALATVKVSSDGTCTYAAGGVHNVGSASSSSASKNLTGLYAML